MRESKIDTFVKKALSKMFTYVGFDSFNEEFTKQYSDWYSRRTWTQEQSDDFKNWFIAAAKKDLKFTPKAAEREYSWFDANWGWKLAEEENV